MKLNQPIYSPLPEGYYKIKIIEFKHMETEHPDGYVELSFTLVDHPERGTQKMNIFPRQLAWILGELTGQSGIKELKDSTDPLHGKTVNLFYTHSYTHNQVVINKKQWQVYEGN